MEVQTGNMVLLAANKAKYPEHRQITQWLSRGTDNKRRNFHSVDRYNYVANLSF